MFNVGDCLRTDTGESIYILDKRPGIIRSEYTVRFNDHTYILNLYKEESNNHIYSSNIKRWCDLDLGEKFVSPQKISLIVERGNIKDGYLMPEVSKDYKRVEDFLRVDESPYAVRFESYGALLKACMNIAALVQKMLLRGIHFMDGIHPGHFLIHPVTGDVLVVGTDFINSRDINNNPYRIVAYCAPEYIENKIDDLYADYFSLGIILYRLLFVDHPFEGALWEKYHLITDDIERQLFGNHAVFHLDPNNYCNRPTLSYAPNVFLRWKVFPIEVRSAFIQTFTEGVKKREKRLSPGEWITILAKCRDKLICMEDSSEQFVNFDDVRSVPPRCLGIKIGEHKVALYPQKAIYQISVDCKHHQYGKIIAEIIYNKQLDSLMIRNMTNTTWRGWSSNTKQFSDILSGEEYLISHGVLIEFQKENPRIIGEIFDVRIGYNNNPVIQGLNRE